MTIRFAAARNAAASPLARILARRPARSAANDNAREGSNSDRENDELLHAALRHFGQHGLRAASVARREAEKAFFAGEHESYQNWLGICRTLDRRMAQQLQREEKADLSL